MNTVYLITECHYDKNGVGIPARTRTSIFSTQELAMNALIELHDYYNKIGIKAEWLNPTQVKRELDSGQWCEWSLGNKFIDEGIAYC